ncbi:MAG: DUF2147 domain-containing protein [Bacteroidia bacterium]
MKTLFIYAALCITLFNYAYAQKNSSPDALNGTWLVEDGTAKVKIEKVAGKYSGKIVWLSEPNDKSGKPMLDTKNPDKSLQSRPQSGLPLLKDFVYDEDNSWTDGTIYDPESGKTYSCKITLKNNQSIEVRGYVGISLFGRTETWKRVENNPVN